MKNLDAKAAVGTEWNKLKHPLPWDVKKVKPK